MFFLNEQNSKLASVNPRSELNGDDHRLACDLRIDIKMSNDILSVFHPKLKAAFYEKDNEDQGELLDAPNHLTALKFPLAGALKWGEEFVGYTAVVNYGIGGPSDIKLNDVKVNNFTFDCQEGGTVAFSLRVQAHPEAEELGKLCTLIQQEVKVTLRPANDAEQAETAERTEARKELHGLFGEGDETEGDPPDFQEVGTVVEDPFAGSDLETGEDLYDKAVAIVRNENRASISLVQRHLKIGYNRAARLIESMEVNGVISAMAADGSREVLPAKDETVDADEARYNEAVAHVKTLDKVSISKVTRKLKVTEIVASRMLQRMEDDGIVGEAGSNGVRDVVTVPA